VSFLRLGTRATLDLPPKEVLMAVLASRAAQSRAALLSIGIGIVLLALIVVGRASAHLDVIDFRQTCSGHRADGHQHSDTIYGSRTCANTPDTFRGLYGDDRIFGYLGNDTLLKGSKGDDRVWGGVGDDRLEGSDGADRLSGGFGSDRVEGGQGRDWMLGGPGDDELYGQAGADRVHGGEGGDVIDCGDGDDEAWGGDGNDTFVNCERTHQ
jgi:Ca2+-binding RTX toxin-like protein